MGKSAASKETMGMRDKKVSMKDKQGFPSVSKEHKFADDLGYFTKPRTKRGK
jgi:hypothetical protein